MNLNMCIFFLNKGDLESSIYLIIIFVNIKHFRVVNELSADFKRQRVKQTRHRKTSQTQLLLPLLPALPLCPLPPPRFLRLHWT